MLSNCIGLKPRSVSSGVDCSCGYNSRHILHDELAWAGKWCDVSGLGDRKDGYDVSRTCASSSIYFQTNPVGMHQCSIHEAVADAIFTYEQSPNRSKECVTFLAV